MLCPHCSVVFDREAPKELENTNTEHLEKVGRRDQRQEFLTRGGPQKAHRPKTYVPHVDGPVRE